MPLYFFAFQDTNYMRITAFLAQQKSARANVKRKKTGPHKLHETHWANFDPYFVDCYY